MFVVMNKRNRRFLRGVRDFFLCIFVFGWSLLMMATYKGPDEISKWLILAQYQAGYCAAGQQVPQLPDPRTIPRNIRGSQHPEVHSPQPETRPLTPALLLLPYYPMSP